MRTAALLLSFMLILTGCERRLGHDYYSETTVDEAVKTYRGTVLSTRKVVVGKDKLGDNSMGRGVGMATGALGGSMIGGGNTPVYAGLAGAIIGGIAGSFAEDELVKQAAIEYTVQLDNPKRDSMSQSSGGSGVNVNVNLGNNNYRDMPGEIMTIVQTQKEGPYPIGSRVFIQVSVKGRSRVFLDHSMQHARPAYPQVGHHTSPVSAVQTMPPHAAAPHVNQAVVKHNA